MQARELLLKKLNSEANEFCASCKVTKSFKRGDVVYRVGDRPGGIFLMESGLVGLFFHSEKGSDHLLRLFKKGQFFAHRAYFADEAHHASAVVLEPTFVSFMRREDVEKLIEIDPRFLRHVVSMLSRELGAAEIHRVMVSEQDVLVRTAHAVAVMKDFAPEHRWTRAEIASFCASTTPTVVRALTELESRGLIQQTGREIQVLDRDGLLQLEFAAD